MTQHSISEIIAYIQKATGKTQTEVARRMSVSQSTVSDWTSGTSQPRPHKRKLLLEWFDECRKAAVAKNQNPSYDEILAVNSTLSTSEALKYYKTMTADFSASLLDTFYGHWYAAQIEFHQGDYEKSYRKNHNLKHFAECFDTDPNFMEMACFNAMTQIDLFRGVNLNRIREKFRQYESESGYTPLANKHGGLLGFHSEVMRLTVLGFTECLLGNQTQALEVINRCHRLVADQNDAFKSVPLSWEADIYYVNNEWRKALECAEKAYELATGTLPLVEAIALIHMGNCKAHLNNDSEAISIISDGLSILKEMNFKFAWTFWLEIHASACLHLKMTEQALSSIEEAIHFSIGIDEQFWMPRILTTKAQILSAIDNSNTPESEELIVQAQKLANMFDFKMIAN